MVQEYIYVITCKGCAYDFYKPVLVVHERDLSPDEKLMLTFLAESDQKIRKEAIARIPTICKALGLTEDSFGISRTRFRVTMMSDNGGLNGSRD